jgi:hypothetical protein
VVPTWQNLAQVGGDPPGGASEGGVVEALDGGRIDLGEVVVGGIEGLLERAYAGDQCLLVGLDGRRRLGDELVGHLVELGVLVEAAVCRTVGWRHGRPGGVR